MRVAVIGAGHWHARMHVEAFRRAGAEIVGVADARGDAAQKLGRELGCPAYPDHRALLDAVRPDFVVAMARHCDAAALATDLLTIGLPFAMEKPLGRNAAEAAPVVELARRRPVFAAVPLVNRYSPLFARVDALRASGELGVLAHAHFRIVNGPPSRYEASGVPWMLEPELAGGGCLLNLGIHCVDAFLRLVGEEVEVVGAQVSSLAHGRRVEDYAVATLRSRSGVVGIVEAGYTYAASAGGDTEWRVAATGAYLVDRAGELQSVSRDGRIERLEAGASGTRYEQFAVDTLARLRAGQPPIATLEDCYWAMQVIDAIYRSAAEG